jgi:transposase
MVNHLVDVSEPHGIDIQVGVGRRRRWSDEAKGRIVAESYAPGAIVVAHRRSCMIRHIMAGIAKRPCGTHIGSVRAKRGGAA